MMEVIQYAMRYKLSIKFHHKEVTIILNVKVLRPNGAYSLKKVNEDTYTVKNDNLQVRPAAKSMLENYTWGGTPNVKD